MARRRGQADPDLAAEWLTLHAAEVLSGISEFKIRQAVKSGEVLQRRAAVGERGSIHRATLMVFAQRYRNSPPGTTQSAPNGSISRAEASQRLGLSTQRTSQVLEAWEHTTGERAVRRAHGRMWIEASVVDDIVQARAHEHETWISVVDASTLVGCAPSTLLRALKQGRIGRRPHYRRRERSLSRESVLSWAQEWKAEQARKEQQAAEAAAAKAALGPPRDGHVWLTPATVSAMLGITTAGVRHLIHNDRIPSVRGSRNRIWIRRDHAEQVAAARALRNHHEKSPLVAHRNPRLII